MSPTESAAARRRQAALAGHRGDEPTVRRYVHDEDWRVRASALRALDRVGALHESDLVSSLSDPRPEVRVVATELAATRATPSLLPSLTDIDPRVVDTACWACGERADPEAGVVDRLVEIVASHPDPLCRESAVAALGALGEGLVGVLGALDDLPAVRRRAVVALAAFEGPEVDAALARARHDKDRQVRDAVDELIGPGETHGTGR